MLCGDLKGKEIQKKRGDIDIDIDIYIYTHTHIYIHTHTHTHVTLYVILYICV